MHAEQVNAQRRVKARRREYAEALHNAEIANRNDFHAQRADQHHAQRDSGADGVGANGCIPCARDDDQNQRNDRKKYHQRGNRHVHHILKFARVAAFAQREHPVADRRNPFHDGKQINARAQAL